MLVLVASAEAVAGITAGATLLAGLALAGVTIHTTNRRLSEEAVRQKRALGHDRQLADLTDLRVLLDEFAVALDRGRTARDEMVLLAQTARHIQPRIHEEVRRTADPAKAIGHELLALTMRLQVRLGGNDPIAVAALGASEALHAMWQQVELLEMTEDFRASRHRRQGI